jgi:hypothetical protein
MKIDLMINTTTLQFQDLNNNRGPDVGETSLVLGKLSDPYTQNEIALCFGVTGLILQKGHLPLWEPKFMILRITAR